MMLTQERQSLIEDYVNQHELCRVSELCDLTATSESTIRRDLIQMEKNGILKRVHGGAQSVKHFSRDVSQNVRFSLNHDAKITIARYAVNTILIGGEVKDDTHAVIGQTALSQIKAMNFSASFVGANGIEKNGNLTTPDPEEAAVKAAEIKQARHAYVLTDNSKIGERNFAVFANTSDVIVVTDQLKPGQKRSLPVGIELEEAK